MQRYTKIFILEVINIISMMMLFIDNSIVIKISTIMNIVSMVAILVYAWAGISERMRDVYVSTE